MAIPLTLSEVPNLTPYVQYVAGSGQTVFPYPFPITQDADLVVVINGVTQATDSGYTLTGQGNDTGGNLTFAVGRTAGDIVTLFRDIAIERITQIGQNSGFSSTAFNAEFNNLYLIAQQLEAQISQALTIPNTNNPAPVTVLTPAAYANKYLSFDANGNPAPAVLTLTGSITAALINSFLNLASAVAIFMFGNGATTQETANSAVIVNYFKLPGNILRYGTNTTPGTTDMSTALTTALLCADSVYLPGDGGPYNFTQTSAFSLRSGQTVYGDGPSSVLKFVNYLGDNLLMSGVSGAIVRDVAIQVSSTAANSYNGAVAVRASSSYCKVIRVQISGVSGCGVKVDASSNNSILQCNFTAFSVGNQDQSDIYIGQLSGSTGSNYNLVDGCQCFGGGDHGVMVQASGTGTSVNLYNTVINCRIGQHNAYGIAFYCANVTSDNFNTASGNYIENIQGTSVTGNSGAGIYSVGSGGNVFTNNTIRNCCVQTSGQLLAPAGIGIAGVTAGLTPCIVSGNTISGMTKFFGIFVVSSPGGASITGNTVLHPVSNVTGNAIGVQASSNVSVVGNSINSLSTQAAVFINALAANMSNITVSGNTVLHAGTGIFVFQAAAFTVANLAITGNQLTSAAAAINMNLAYLAGATIVGNTAINAGASCLTIANCTQTRMSSNTLTTTAASAFNSSGTCTGSILDESNYLSGSSGFGANGTNNAATGCNCRCLLSGSPSAGTAATGDASYDTSGVKFVYKFASGSWSAVI